jgi:hypothetical protein
MKMTDSIMQDIWKAKDEIAMESGYNLKRLAEVLKTQQASSHAKIIDYHHRTTLPPGSPSARAPEQPVAPGSSGLKQAWPGSAGDPSVR